MNFTIEQKDRAAIFRPQEARLDSMLAPELKAEFLILAQPDVETLIIDLTDVEYVDSAGLSALLLARRQQTSHDGDVRLVGVRDEVRSLLELTQLNRVFPIYDTTQQAIEAPSLSAIVVPADDDIDSTTSALGSGIKTVAIGTGVAALGAIALGGDEDVDDEDEDYDDEDEAYVDDEDEELLDEEEAEEEDEEKGEKADEDDDEDEDLETDEDFEYEDDLDFDEDDEDEEDF